MRQFQNPAASARSRRPKDKESRHNTGGTSGRRPRESSRLGESRSPPPASRHSQSSLYAQQNLTLDQLSNLPLPGDQTPSLPPSGTVSPTSSTSPVLRNNQIPVSSPGVYQLSQPPYTPAALQQYLERDNKVDDSPAPVLSHDHGLANTPSSFAADLSNMSASTEKPPPPQSPPLRVFETVSIRSSSPPVVLDTHMNIQSPIPRKPFTLDKHQQNIAYTTGLQDSIGSVPFYASFRDEHFYLPSYAGPYQISIPQPGTHPTDPQQYPAQNMSYYTEYGSPHLATVSLNTARSPSVPGQTPNLPGYAFLSPTQAPMDRTIEGLREAGFGSGQAPDEGEGELLHRIQSAVPDLHPLPSWLREISSELGVQENLIRRSEAQKTEALRQKESYIDRLAKELENASQKHTVESSKLRLEIGKWEEKCKELQEHFATRKKSRDDLEAMNGCLERENEHLTHRANEENNAVILDLKMRKHRARDDHEMRERALRDELNVKTGSEDALRYQITQMELSHSKETENLQAIWKRQRNDLEASHSKDIKELGFALEECHNSLEDALSTRNEELEKWNREREVLRQEIDRERDRLNADWGEKHRMLLAQHEQDKERLRNTWQSNGTGYSQDLEEDNAKLRKEIELLKSSWDFDKTKFTKATRDLKAVATKLNNENSNLQKVMEAFGEASDFRSRGDTYL